MGCFTKGSGACIVQLHYFFAVLLTGACAVISLYLYNSYRPGDVPEIKIEIPKNIKTDRFNSSAHVISWTTVVCLAAFLIEFGYHIMVSFGIGCRGKSHQVGMKYCQALFLGLFGVTWRILALGAFGVVILLFRISEDKLKITIFALGFISLHLGSVLAWIGYAKAVYSAFSEKDTFDVDMMLKQAKIGNETNAALVGSAV